MRSKNSLLRHVGGVQLRRTENERHRNPRPDVRPLGWNGHGHERVELVQTAPPAHPELAQAQPQVVRACQQRGHADLPRHVRGHRSLQGWPPG